jgi:hypothetical protein
MTIRILTVALGCALSVAAVAQTVTSQPAGGIRPGVWSHVPTATGSDAVFTDTAGVQQLVVRCTRATRQVTISVRSIPATSMLIWASSASRNVQARYDAKTNGVTVTFPFSDGILDAIAFSRGRFSVTVPGLSPLVVPAHPEPARAIEDCRN